MDLPFLDIPLHDETPNKVLQIKIRDTFPATFIDPTQTKKHLVRKTVRFPYEMLYLFRDLADSPFHGGH